VAQQWPDRLGMTLAVSGISFPAFALGMLLMEVFSVQLGWLPSIGADSWKHYILPSLTLGAAVAAVMARFTRARSSRCCRRTSCAPRAPRACARPWW
jgi:glutathione transport system permease protein